MVRKIKPLVIISENHFLDSTRTIYNVINTWKSSGASTEVSKQKAYETIEQFNLPLVYKDINGKIFADPENNPYKEIKEVKNCQNPKLQHELLKRKKWIINNI